MLTSDGWHETMQIAIPLQEAPTRKDRYYSGLDVTWMADISADFYQNLQGFDDFPSVTDLSLYSSLPDDWCIVLADIKGSTKAIEEGRYKDVNMMGRRASPPLSTRCSSATSPMSLAAMARLWPFPYPPRLWSNTCWEPRASSPEINSAWIYGQELCRSATSETLVLMFWWQSSGSAPEIPWPCLLVVVSTWWTP